VDTSGTDQIMVATKAIAPANPAMRQPYTTTIAPTSGHAAIRAIRRMLRGVSV
jgi:hypothetical protein